MKGPGGESGIEKQEIKEYNCQGECNCIEPTMEEQRIIRFPGEDTQSMKRSMGVTLIELMVGVTIIAILMAIASFGYKNYEARYRCQSAAQVLIMDIRMQQQRAKRFDTEQGIYFYNQYKYALGTTDDKVPASTFFRETYPRRFVDLRQQYYGVYIESIGGNPPPCYIKFDPKALDTLTGDWMPFSGFKGDIVIKGNARTITLTVQNNREITTQMQ